MTAQARIIPDRWLQGCMLGLTNRGMDYMDALKEAVRLWREQEELEKRFHEQKAVTE